MEHDFKIVKLHDVPTLIEETALLLNSEWPRSLEARYITLMFATQVMQPMIDGN